MVKVRVMVGIKARAVTGLQQGCSRWAGREGHRHAILVKVRVAVGMKARAVAGL